MIKLYNWKLFTCTTCHTDNLSYVFFWSSFSFLPRLSRKLCRLKNYIPLFFNYLCPCPFVCRMVSDSCLTKLYNIFFIVALCDFDWSPWTPKNFSWRLDTVFFLLRHEKNKNKILTRENNDLQWNKKKNERTRTFN